MSKGLGTIDSSICDTIQSTIEEALEGAKARVSGGGGRFTIHIVAACFEGKNMVQSQRLVYSAIAHLMAGEGAPVHAVDSMTTEVPT